MISIIRWLVAETVGLAQDLWLLATNCCDYEEDCDAEL